MNGDNKINIDTLVLGDKIDSKDAPSLPLELAIALLKDSNDQIDIDLPISGDLDNPQFDYSKIIWKAIGNLIVGIVTSPFKFLGSMLGIETEKLKAIDFPVGSSSLVSSEIEKGDLYKKLLSKRPKIKLEIEGCYDDKRDKEALKDIKLEAMIKKEEKKVSKRPKKEILYTF